LQAAVSWLEKYPGKKVVRGYARWFGVDLICAARELQMLGVALDPGYIERLHASARARCTRRAKLTQEEPLDDLIESDDDFSFIAGYTSAGIPYGVPWEDTGCTESYEFYPSSLGRLVRR